MFAALATLALLTNPVASAGKASSGAADSDGDGMPDSKDLCPGEDDTVDLDLNGTQDCVETFAHDFGFGPSDSGSFWTRNTGWVWHNDWWPASMTNNSTRGCLGLRFDPAAAQEKRSSQSTWWPEVIATTRLIRPVSHSSRSKGGGWRVAC